MAIRLIRPGRSFSVEIGGALFMVRRLTDAAKAALDEVHAQGTPARAAAFIKQTVVGWENVVDEAGTPLPYDPDLVPLLPWESVIEPILERLRGGPDPLAARAASATLPPSTTTENG